MTKTLFALLTGLLYCSAALSQSSSVKGIIADTSSKTSLQNAVVSLLQPKDSVLVKFTRTKAGGQFEINNVPAGKYLLVVSYPKYAEYADEILIEPNNSFNAGTIPVILKAKLLEEVVVRQKIAAIRFKGDTLEFKADSFRVNANANVQELLKKLPGLQVNSKGEITAQGEKIEKVLVDGEEFFSDDPAVVTQSLRADAVDKVQVFDKKSDQAAFTGIDDGQKTKTINLQLKEDKKKGYFGKVEAGTDFNRYRYGKALGNLFSGKKKLAGYITTDNTKFESLNWEERRNYGSDNNTVVMEGGGIMVTSTGDDFSWGQGLPNSVTAGLLFSNKWSKDKYNTNNNYQFNQLQVEGINSSTTQTILPDTSFINTTNQNFSGTRQRNRLQSMFEWAIDSSSSLKLTAVGSLSNNKNNNRFLGKSISEEGQLINQSDRNTLNADETQNFSSTLFYRKRLKKKGRSLSVSGDFNFTNRNNNGFLLADNTFYNSLGSVIKNEKLDQNKTLQEAANTFNSRFSYTEPVSKNTFAEFSYRIGVNRNNSERNTLEKQQPGNVKYDFMVDSLSNHFIFNTTTNAGGLTLRHNKTKYGFFLGASVERVHFNQEDIRKGNSNSIGFTNFLPTAGINFNPKKQRRIALNYNTTARIPNLQQIQPIIDNTDPLNITIGNKNLKQEYRHSFRFNANDYKVLKNKSIYFNINLTVTDNAITNSNYIDSIGRRINQAVNVDGNYNFNMWSSYGFEIAPSLNLNFGLSPNVSRYINFVNGQKNINDNGSLGAELSLSFWGDKKINFWSNFQPRYNRSVSSIRKEVVTKYWTYNTDLNVEIKLPKKFFFQVNADINIYQKTTVFANTRNVYYINTSLRKTFLKNDVMEAKVYVNDLFNQNQGINRNISSNFITESTQQVVRRYVMFSLAYNFSKNGKPQSF
ncbi:MAG: hypothetical protein RLZZ316_3150 [Bacteroidota bacterium]